jgi:hypothetical protein
VALAAVRASDKEEEEEEEEEEEARLGVVGVRLRIDCVKPTEFQYCTWGRGGTENDLGGPGGSPGLPVH